MILFEFFCNDCKKEFEELTTPLNDSVKCPYCGSLNTKKLISAVNVKGVEKSSGLTSNSCSSTGNFA